MSSHGFQPKCRKISLDKMIVTPGPKFVPLCQTCIQRDCGNPIEPREVSIYGIMKSWRLYISQGSPMAVVDCEAYLKKDDDPENENTTSEE